MNTLLDGTDESLLDGENKCIAWPFVLGGDKGYRADWIDDYPLELGIRLIIPTTENEDRDARPVERLVGWLKEIQIIFFRFENTAKNFGGMLNISLMQQYL